MRYLLDTHTWIWWNMNPTKLSIKAHDLISNPSKYEELLISAISLWEFSKLVEKNRISISCDPEKWMWEALDIPGLQLVPLTPTIAVRSTTLPGKFHDDPADQIIVATARDEGITIITADRLIQNYEHVKCFW